MDQQKDRHLSEQFSTMALNDKTSDDIPQLCNQPLEVIIESREKLNKTNVSQSTSCNECLDLSIRDRSALLLAEKEKGNEALKQNKVEEAVDIYTKALDIDPSDVLTNAKLYFNRSIAYLKLNKLNEAIDDCSSAIQLNDNYIKAYLRRAKLNMDSKKYKKAVRDYETVLNKENTTENKTLLENAKLELKKSKRKYYYKCLGVATNATADEIKKAYKSKAMAHHPDRHTNSSESKKKIHEIKFKNIVKAYAVLNDPKKRSRYDNGHDLKGNE